MSDQGSTNYIVRDRGVCGQTAPETKSAGAKVKEMEGVPVSGAGVVVVR